MDRLFLIGIALLPFENFFFAPSAGWAALSPLVFFVYALCQRNLFQLALKKHFPIFVFTICCLALSFFDYLLLGEFYLENFVDTVSTFALGLGCLYSFEIYLNIKKRSLARLVKVIVVSYSIALLIGLVEFAAVKLGIGAILNGFELIMKRCYLPRVQFMFTEPSFTTMHLFGVLLPFYMVTKEKRLIVLIGGFVVVSLLSSSSLRLLIDVAAVLLLVAANYMDWTKVRTLFTLVVIPCMLIAFVFIGMQLNPRFASMLEKGWDSDGSFASRAFRVEAVANGLVENPVHALLGCGAGNAWVVIKDGYDRAVEGYTNSYTGEVVFLGRPDARPTSVFCMYARIAGEYGVVVLLLVVAYFVQMNRRVRSRDWRLLLIVCAYLYIQFDGYGFYAIWIVIALSNFASYRNNTEVTE